MSRRSSSQKVSIPAPGALRATAAAARRNGAHLLEDAKLLFDAGRYPRAAAISILAEEEFLKAFVLDNASVQERWDRILFDALRLHGPKLALAEGLREMATSLRAGGLSEAELDVLANKAKRLIPGNERNLLKQRAFYVDVGPNGDYESMPSQITRDEASACLHAAKEMLEAVMQQLLGLPAVAVVHPDRYRSTS